MSTTDASSYHVLIVEDTDDIARIMEMTLERVGVASTIASSGPKALDFMAQRMPDLLLLDIGLPGMSGWEVLDAIKARHSDAQFPVIVLTALGDPANRLIGKFQAHVVRYFVKPFEVTDLEQAVREALNL